MNSAPHISFQVVGSAYNKRCRQSQPKKSVSPSGKVIVRWPHFKSWKTACGSPPTYWRTYFFSYLLIICTENCEWNRTLKWHFRPPCKVSSTKLSWTNEISTIKVSMQESFPVHIHTEKITPLNAFAFSWMTLFARLSLRFTILILKYFHARKFYDKSLAMFFSSLFTSSIAWRVTAKYCTATEWLTSKIALLHVLVLLWCSSNIYMQRAMGKREVYENL